MVSLVFSGGRMSLYAFVYEHLQSALNRIWIECFAFNAEEIIDLLKKKSEAGVDVRILLDGNSENFKYWVKEGKVKTFRRMEVRFGNPSLFQTYHLKMAIIDNSLLFGTANWTGGGLIRNREGIVLIDYEDEIVRKAVEVFEEDWRAGTTEIKKFKKPIWMVMYDLFRRNA